MIPLAKPSITDLEIAAVTKVLKSGILSMGKYTQEFEKKFSDLTQTKYAVAVNSGTSGLHLCVRALGIKEGDEIITTPFSFVASSNCILFEKAKPVFVDISMNDYAIDPTKIESAITEKTKAILVVHIFGQIANMPEIMKIAKKYNLKVIEDACESINAKINNQPAGSFGDLSVFAFYPNKQITTGEGGMITTNDESLANKMKSMRNQGRDPDPTWLTHTQLGYNYRLDEMSAALGVEQLKRIDEIILKRQAAAKKYTELLQNMDLIIPTTCINRTNTWFVYPIRIKNRNEIMNQLQQKGVACRAYFDPPIHLQPFYIKEFGYTKGMFPNTEKASEEILVLPFYTDINTEDLKTVADTLKEVI